MPPTNNTTKAAFTSIELVSQTQNQNEITQNLHKYERERERDLTMAFEIE